MPGTRTGRPAGRRETPLRDAASRTPKTPQNKSFNGAGTGMVVVNVSLVLQRWVRDVADAMSGCLMALVLKRTTVLLRNTG